MYLLGGFWDTVWVPAGQSAGFRGTLLVRLLAARAECDRPHPIEIRCEGEDGALIFNVNLTATPTIPPGHPVARQIPLTIVAGLAGPLPRLGLYNIAVLADNALVAEIPFRAVELPAGPPGIQGGPPLATLG